MEMQTPNSVVETAVDVGCDVVSNPGMSVAQKVIAGASIVLTGGLVVFGIALWRRHKAKKRAASSTETPENTENHAN